MIGFDRRNSVKMAGELRDALETINAAANAIASAENRIPTSSYSSQIQVNYVYLFESDLKLVFDCVCVCVFV